MKKHLLKMSNMCLSFTLGLSLLTACNSSDEVATSDEQASNFPEEEIKVIVPYSSGGGFDTAARMLVPYWEKYLPNDADMVVENISGGAGNMGLGEVTRADADGHTVGLINLPGHFVNQIVGEASYDLSEFEYIGTITTTNYVAATSPDSNYTSLEELQEADEVLGGITNISSTDGLGLVIAAEELGINLNTINHDGSTEAMLSAIRGDSDIVQYPVESTMEHIESGDLEPLWVYADERLEELPDTPTIFEVGHEDESILDLISLHRSIASTPGTPEEVTEILRESFQQAVNDEEYIKEVEESGATWNPNEYEQTERVVENSLEMLQPFEDMLKSDR